MCSRKGLEKGSGALANATTRCADGSNSRIISTLLPANSAVTPAMPVTLPPGRLRLSTSPVPIGSPAICVDELEARIELDSPNIICNRGITLSPVIVSEPAPVIGIDILCIEFDGQDILFPVMTSESTAEEGIHVFGIELNCLVIVRNGKIGIALETI